MMKLIGTNVAVVGATSSDADIRQAIHDLRANSSVHRLQVVVNDSLLSWVESSGAEDAWVGGAGSKQLSFLVFEELVGVVEPPNLPNHVRVRRFSSPSKMLTGIDMRENTATLIVLEELPTAVLRTLDRRFGGLLSVSAASLAEVMGVRLDNRYFNFAVVPGVGAVALGGTLPENAVVPGTVAKMPLIGICEGAFARTEAKTLFLSSPVQWIGAKAFEHNEVLESVLLPHTVQMIGDDAFSGCSSLRVVNLPPSVTFIGKGAFDACNPEVKFRVTGGSYSHRWAEDRGFHTVVLEDSDLETAPTTHRVEEPFSEDGIDFLPLPDNCVQVTGLDPKRREVTIPGYVRGCKVVGLALESPLELRRSTRLNVPKTVGWIALSSQFSNTSDDVEIDRALRTPTLVGFEGSKGTISGVGTSEDFALDIDQVFLSLRMVAHILGVQVQSISSHKQDKILTGMAAARITTAAGNLYFSRSKDLYPEEVDLLLGRQAWAFVSSAPATDTSGTVHPTLVVDDPAGAFIRVCSWIGQHYSSKKLALTGSVGKTTTKEMVRLVAQEQNRTLYSLGNQNGLAQVGRYVQRQTYLTEVYIQETGAARPGLVESGAQMLHPDAFLITNIGLNHVGGYGGSQERLLADKLSLDHYLPDDGVAFVNYDDPVLRRVELHHRIVSYSTNDSAADYYATNIIEAEGELRFNIVEAKTGHSSPARVRAFGIHNVSNAVAAFAIGRWLGTPANLIVKGLEKYRATGLRQNFTTLGDKRVLVDCYNASETAAASVVRALQSITPFDGGSRYLVFGDIDDKLGDFTEEVHRRVGEDFAQQPAIDKYFLFGEHNRWVAEELRAAGIDHFHTTDRTELEAVISQSLTEADVIAFKGGQQMALSISLDHIFGTSFVLEDGDVLQRRGKVLEESGVRYRFVREYGGIILSFPKNLEGTVAIPEYVGGQKVRMVGPSAGSRSKLTAVKLSEDITNIGNSAFFNSRSLQRIDLPNSLKIIERSAFNNCRSLEEARIPEGTTTIGDRAFYACTQLRSVRIPSSVVVFGADVFARSNDVVVECEPGSAADKYCLENGIETSYREHKTAKEILPNMETANEHSLAASRAEAVMNIPSEAAASAPKATDKVLTVERVRIVEDPAGNTSRLIFTVRGDRGTDELWYEVENEYAKSLCDDRCDAAIVAMMPLAIRAGYDVIRSDIPMSDELLYSLQYHVLPQLTSITAEDETYKPMRLDIPSTDAIFNRDGRGAIGTGMSLGIDSFATLSEYGRQVGPEQRRITHLTYFDVGAHHGYDWRTGKGPYSSDELYKGHLEKVQRFAAEYGYPLVVVRSNLSKFLPRNFVRSQFYHTHTYRNVSAVLILQKLFSSYYYSSAANIGDFEVSLRKTSAAYDKWLLPMLDTGSTKFYSANQQWDRFEKTLRVAAMPESQNYLTICFTGIDNCGRCDKCIKTLMTLDVLGPEVLEKFGNVFDLATYHRLHRKRYFNSIYREIRRTGLSGDDMRRVFDHGLKRDFALIPEPRLEAVKTKSEFVSAGGRSVRIRKLPFAQARVVGMLRGEHFHEVVGSYGPWKKIVTDRVTGFVNSGVAEVLTVEGVSDPYIARAVNDTAVFSIPDAKSEATGAIHSGEDAPIRGCAKDWILVDHDGQAGFVETKHVEILVPDMSRRAAKDNLVRTTVPAALKSSLLPCARIEHIPANRRFLVKEASDSWASVTNGMSSGYLELEYLEELKPVKYVRSRRVVLLEDAPLQLLPTKVSSVVTELEAGTRLKVVASLRKWRWVETSSGYKGCLPSEILEIQPKKHGMTSRAVRRVMKLFSK